MWIGLQTQSIESCEIPRDSRNRGIPRALHEASAAREVGASDLFHFSVCRPRRGCDRRKNRYQCAEDRQADTTSGIGLRVSHDADDDYEHSGTKEARGDQTTVHTFVVTRVVLVGTVRQRACDTQRSEGKRGERKHSSQNYCVADARNEGNVAATNSDQGSEIDRKGSPLPPSDAMPTFIIMALQVVSEATAASSRSVAHVQDPPVQASRPPQLRRRAETEKCRSRLSNPPRRRLLEAGLNQSARRRCTSASLSSASRSGATVLVIRQGARYG
jgi:hypothetical protein